MTCRRPGRSRRWWRKSPAWSQSGRTPDVQIADVTRGAASTGARAVITTDALAPSFEAARPGCPDLELVLSREQLDAPAVEPDDWPSLDDIAFVQFTSGSTSSPKGVALTHANVCANVDAFAGPSGVARGPGDLGVSWLPLN